MTKLNRTLTFLKKKRKIGNFLQEVVDYRKLAILSGIRDYIEANIEHVLYYYYKSSGSERAIQVADQMLNYFGLPGSTGIQRENIIDFLIEYQEDINLHGYKNTSTDVEEEINYIIKQIKDKSSQDIMKLSKAIEIFIIEEIENLSSRR